MHEDVKKFADARDIRRLRYIFVDCLDVDPTFEKYAEDYAYCKNVEGLFEPYKELTPFKNNSAEWDSDYWTNLKEDLLKNFSVRRFEHMREAAKVVYGEKIARLKMERDHVAQERKAIVPDPKTVIAPSGDRTDQKKEMPSEVQRRALEEEKKKREEAYQRQRAEEERHNRERQEKREAAGQRGEMPGAGDSGSKKVMGIVLVVAVVILLLLVIRLV